MSGEVILAIDQGTSSTKCLLVDRKGDVVASGMTELGLRHPHPGWVEQDPIEIWDSVKAAVAQAVAGHQTKVVGIGFSTQRELLVVWDRRTGEPVSAVLGWQDQRTASMCAALRTDEIERIVQDRSGLPLDPMFSAVKARWVLNQIDPSGSRARSGDLCLGTVDSWLLSRFGGEHLIEAGNAARTQILNVRAVAWDDELLELFDIPRAMLPNVVRSDGPFPTSRDLPGLPDGIPVLAVMGDSHSALFAHGAFTPGQVKATYGSGSSVMGLIEKPEALKARRLPDDWLDVGPACLRRRRQHPLQRFHGALGCRPARDIDPGAGRPRCRCQQRRCGAGPSIRRPGRTLLGPRCRSDHYRPGTRRVTPRGRSCCPGIPSRTK